MRVELATEPGDADKPNEDFVAATTSGVVLVDGAGVAPPYPGCRHGVAWFARQLGGHLAARVDDHGRSLVELLADAIDATADGHRSTCDLDDPSAPFATVLLFRVTSEGTEHLALADSVLLLVGPDGDVRAITDDREARVMQPHRARYDAVATGSAEHAEARDRYIDALRGLRNHPGGFWVAASNPAAAAHAVVGESRDVRSAILLSNGASRLVDTFGLATWSELVGLVEQQGAGEVIRRVRAAEASDPDGSRWPRRALCDDATIASVFTLR